MEMYRNLGGNSGVANYELGSDSVTVQFNDGAVYLYNYVSAASKGSGSDCFTIIGEFTFQPHHV